MTRHTPVRHSSFRVVKVGGSLLSLPRLASVLEQWLTRQPNMPTLLVVGGGDLADAVRALDRRQAIDEAAAHWMAVRAMQVNAFALCQVLTNAHWVTDLRPWCAAGGHTCGRIGVVAPEDFLKYHEPHQPGTGLPIGWHVTSDSIAARLADMVRAAELVLLKSTLPESPSTTLSCREAVAQALVDDYFPTCAVGLPHIRVVNLRSETQDEIQLVP